MANVSVQGKVPGTGAYCKGQAMHFEPRLWTFTEGVRLRILWAVLIGLIAAGLGVARLGLLGWLIGEVFAGRDLQSLALPIALIALVMMLRGAFEHWRAMVLTNVYGAAITVRATFDQLRERRGHLFLMGSVAGRKVPPGSVYGATKWAVTAMAEAARQELNGTGVRVTLISPGTVETPFYDEPVGGEQLTAGDVARAVLFAMDQPPHVDVNEILIRPTVQDF